MSDVDYRGKVRARDPETSWDAAAQQTRAKVSVVQVALYALLAMPATDEQLVFRYRQYRERHPQLPNVTPQSIRSRRAELVTRGLVRVSGTGRSMLGNRATLWIAVPK